MIPFFGKVFGIAYIETMACGATALGPAVSGAPDALFGGVLVRAVTSEGFEQALREGTTAPMFDPDQLSMAIGERFGHASFERRVHNALDATFDQPLD